MPEYKLGAGGGGGGGLMVAGTDAKLCVWFAWPKKS